MSDIVEPVADREIVLDARQLGRIYQEGPEQVPVLDGVDLTLHQGDLTAIVGSSGSGKTTLLNLLGGLDQPTSGTVQVAGQNLANLNEREMCLLRNTHLGFIYQFHHLLPEFTALENAAMPLLVRGENPRVATKKAQDLLEKVGLAARIKHKPAQLSGGERQRVAIARALVGEPAIVLADEPTGNLDEKTAEHVQALMLELNEQLGTAFLLVTHDLDLARRCKACLSLHEGRLAPLSE